MKKKQNNSADLSGEQVSDETFNDPRIRKAAEVILALLSTATKEDALARYNVGAEVNKVKALASGAKYGTGVVDRLASVVGLTPAALYSYATVAETWSAKAVADYARRRVTFSHFVELAHSAHKQNRSTLLERTAKERLSVRDLRAMRSEPHADVLERLDSKRPSKEIRDEIAKSLQALRTQASKIAKRTRQLEAALRRCDDPANNTEVQQAAE